MRSISESSNIEHIIVVVICLNFPLKLSFLPSIKSLNATDLWIVNKIKLI